MDQQKFTHSVADILQQGNNSKNPKNLYSTILDEESWIEVIQQMDRVYSELVDSQTALENKNQELENAQEFINSVMGSMTDLMIVCDTEHRIQQVNLALVQLTGIDADKLEGCLLTSLLLGDSSHIQEDFYNQLSNNQSFSDWRVFVQDSNDISVPVSFNCSPRKDHRNRLVGMVLIGRPMGELQRVNSKLDVALKNFENAQNHLLRSEKMATLGRLVAGVAHELNNPISFVYGNMHALKSYGEKISAFLDATNNNMSEEENKSLRKNLQIDRIAKDIIPLVEGTLEGAQRVSEIVQDLRRFSSTQSEPNERIMVQPIIETAINWVMRGTKKGPQIKIDCPTSLHVFSRKGHINQILVNLLQNAFDASAGVDKPVITILAEHIDSHISIIISDNGTGIVEQDIEKIFEPFYTTKPVGKGTGLGLYVSYKMAREVEGIITAQNLLESGAMFTLKIPMNHSESIK